MNHPKKAGLILACLASIAISTQGQVVYEQMRSGNNTTGSNNPDFTLSNFSATISSLHSSAPGQPTGVSSSRFATTPANTSTSFTVSPTNKLTVGQTYVVAVTWPNNTTGGQLESPDILVNASDTGMSGIDTLSGITGAFKQGALHNANTWVTVGLVTVNSTTPTMTFTWNAGPTTDRWYADALQFTPVAALPTAQYWDTGLGLGGSGTWDTTTSNWNPNSDGSGTEQAYTQGDLAYFGGTAGTVTIDPVNGVTSDGGLLFASSGYVIQGGPLTLGQSSNIIVTGTNIATINSALPGPNGLSMFGGSGTLMLGATTVNGPVSPSAGLLQLTGNTTFGQLGGGTLGGGVLNLGSYTLAVGDTTTNTCGSSIIDAGAGTPGSLVKQGTGWLNLTGTNLFHGTTTINQGTLGVTSDLNFGTPPSALVANQLNLNGGTLFLSGTSILSLNAKRGITLSGSNVISTFPTQREITFNCPITGNGSITLPCCWPDFNATNTFTGDLIFQLTNNISARFNTNNSAGLGRIHVMPMTPSGTPFTIRNLAPSGATTTISNAIFFDESVTNAQSYNVDTAGVNGTFTLSGNITGKTTGGVNINDNPNSGGNVVLSGDNSGFTGGFNLQGGTLTLGSATALGSGLFVVNDSVETTWPTMTLQASVPLSGATAITNTVYLNAPSGSSTLVLQGSNPIQFSGPVHIGGAGGVGITVNNSAATTISGNMDDGGLNLGLTLNGTGTLTLQGSNSFTGNTLLSSGTLDVAGASSLSSTTTTAYGGNLQVDNAHGIPATNSLIIISPSIVNLTYSGSMTIGSLSINGTQEPNGTYGASANNPQGVFTGPGTLVVGATAGSPPTISKVTVSGTTLSLSGTGGTPNAGYRVLSSTSLTANLNTWTQVGSGSFAQDGSFSFAGTYNPADAQRFFVIVSP